MSCSVPTAADLADGAFVVSSPASLQVPNSTSFVTRSGSVLLQDGQPVKLSGANIYWLGVDENLGSTPVAPSRQRVVGVLATAATMGGNAVRSHTLGVSVGCKNCVEPSLGVFNQDALRAIDFAVYAASQYGIKLVIPLTDHYAYYHGGIETFLSWRGLSTSDHSPFYNTSSQVYADFTRYVRVLLDRNNSITGRPYANDSTIAVIETGNELGGWNGGSKSWPPTDWTRSIAQLVSSILPNALVMDGSYGINPAALSIDEVDIYSNHYYPLYADRVTRDANTATSAGKAFIAGEYAWTAPQYRILLLVSLIPLIIGVVVLFLPKRWFPINVPCCWRRRPQDIDRPDSSQYSLMTSSDKGEFVAPVERPQRWSFGIRSIDIACFFFLLVPVAALVIWFTAPSYLYQFLGAIEASPASGDLYWSLLGRTDDCCGYVTHNDGYTLHYPGDTLDMRDAVITLTQHDYTMTNVTLGNWTDSIADINATVLPVVACPQDPLALM